MSEQMGGADFDIRILGGSPSDEEVAAVTAVLNVALEELADDLGQRQRDSQSAWARSQRAIRTPLTPGAWPSF